MTKWKKKTIQNISLIYKKWVKRILFWYKTIYFRDEYLDET